MTLGSVVYLTMLYTPGPQRFLKWVETNRSQRTTGIPKDRLPDYVEEIKDDFSLSAQNLGDHFLRDTVVQLANDCGRRGLATKLYGDVDNQTKVCAVVHCIQDGRDTVTVSYAVKSLKTVEFREGVRPRITDTRSTKEQPDQETSDFLKQTEEMLKNDTGVDISR